MEMPIKLMITLFVTLIVGSTIIFFAKDMIEKSKEDIQNHRPGYDATEVENQKIIQLNRLTEGQIIDLVQECYDRNHLKTLSRDLCFVVIAKEADTWSYFNIEDHFLARPKFKANLSIVDEVVDGDDSMSIYFNPFGNSETIELTKQ